MLYYRHKITWSKQSLATITITENLAVSRNIAAQNGQVCNTPLD